MTENEAIIGLKAVMNEEFQTENQEEAYKLAIQALEEIQQYRAMEEKLNGISVERVVNGFINVTEKGTDEGYERGRILTNAEADMWNEYRAIGTIEEFKAFRSGDFTEDLLNMGYTKGYNKAIDEFAEKLIGRLEESKKVLEEAAVKEMGTNGHTLDFENYNGGIGAVKCVITLVKHLAEQMKGGAE